MAIDHKSPEQNTVASFKYANASILEKFKINISKII